MNRELHTHKQLRVETTAETEKITKMSVISRFIFLGVLLFISCSKRSPTPPAPVAETPATAPASTPQASSAPSSLDPVAARQSWHIPSSALRIQFARGSTVATIIDSLSGMEDHAYFTFDAKANQHATLTIQGRGATAAVVIFPDGSQEGGPGGIIFDGRLPASGKSTIRVFEHQMAEAWKGKYTLTLKIE
jgi:hypothetical protein